MMDRLELLPVGRLLSPDLIQRCAESVQTIARCVSETLTALIPGVIAAIKEVIRSYDDSLLTLATPRERYILKHTKKRRIRQKIVNRLRRRYEAISDDPEK